MADVSKLVDLLLRRSKAGRDQISTAAQETRGREWAERHGLTVRHVWVDLASASRESSKRPDYDRAMLALQRGEVRTLWCYKLDRFSRMGAVAVLTVLDSLEGARIVFESDGLDSSDPTHRRMIMWRAEDAREETDRISERLRDSFSVARDAGLWVPSKAPYGYVRTPDKRLAIDEPAADVVRSIFKAAATASVPAIVRDLNARGIPAPAGGRWAVGTVYAMLQHPTYAGWKARLDGARRVPYLNRNGERVRVCEGIVSDATQAAVRAKLTSRTVMTSKGRRAGDRSAPRHLGTDLLFCAGCGRRMVSTAGSYRCTSVSLGGKECGAPAFILREAANRVLFQAFESRLTACEPDDPLLEAVAGRWLASHAPEVLVERQRATDAIEGAQARLRDLLDARYKRREFEGEAARYFPDLLAEAEAAVATARRALSELPVPQADIGYLLEPELVEEAWAGSTLPAQREILRLAVHGVCVRRSPGKGKPITPERFVFVWADESRDAE